MARSAGLDFEVARPKVEEEPIKAAFSGDDASLARALAEAKAIDVSATIGTCDWVIGSDSIVSVAGERFSKPKDRDDAIGHLSAFRGKTLELTSAVALVRDAKVEWSFTDAARLDVRDFSDRFIADYLDADWPQVSYCVGVFRMEGRGVQLFNRIEGDHFTILGMPLIPLLGALRQRGVIPE
jgi:septum formation protein